MECVCCIFTRRELGWCTIELSGGLESFCFAFLSSLPPARRLHIASTPPCASPVLGFSRRSPCLAQQAFGAAPHRAAAGAPTGMACLAQAEQACNSTGHVFYACASSAAPRLHIACTSPAHRPSEGSPWVSSVATTRPPPLDCCAGRRPYVARRGRTSVEASCRRMVKPRTPPKAFTYMCCRRGIACIVSSQACRAKTFKLVMPPSGTDGCIMLVRSIRKKTATTRHQ